MESQLEKLSLTEPSTETPLKFTFTEYTIKTKSCDDLSLSLPFPSELQSLIALNTLSDQISIDSTKLLSFFEPNNTINFLSNDYIHSSIILKAILAFLGSINVENDFTQITDESSIPPISEEQFVENSINYFSYIEKNKSLIFSLLKLKDFFLFVNALDFIGVKLPKDSVLYKSMKTLIMTHDKIMIIVAPSNNFWIKSEQVNINGVNYDKKLNNYSNIFFNTQFVKKFMEKIGKHPRCYLGLISSMTHKNLKSTFDSLKMECDFPSEVPLFDQVHHINTNDTGKGKPTFVRSMELIKNGLKIYKQEEFGEGNIVILESEEDKINNTKDNSLPMSLFSEQYLMYDKTDENRKKMDKCQDDVITYLETLLENCTEDIREYLHNHPLK